jgi:hypothetical protein
LENKKLAVPKWNEERTTKLQTAVGNESPVTRETVARVAEELETTPRSVASKLRKLNVEVEAAGSTPSKFSEDEAAELAEFVEANRGNLTYGQIAENFNGGKFSAKQIQGKILSMELTGAVAPTPKAEVQKTYTDAEQAQIISLVNSGAFVEDIAKQVGREVASVRGKALSLLRAGEITAMPKQRDVKGTSPDAFEALGDVSGLTVEEVATKLDKTARGVKTMATRRGVKLKDYDGAAKRAKAAEATA